MSSLPVNWPSIFRTAGFPKNLPKLIADRAHRLQAVTFRPAGKFPIPEVSGHRVERLPDNTCPVLFISEHAVDIKQGRVFGIQSRHAVAWYKMN